MARHRQPPLADCRHGIDHTHRDPRHATGRACDEKVTVIRLFAYLHDSCREDAL